ncbi:hypothetical protein BD324DRAFT_681509 [Kockovaella imperatae]|uniref:Uncharacterized protein n=1 Tax=Kockovaella imperatae TaxID=4999 RepID=A0A1Y1UFB9_9TREE|nr:hypothetical protein BD324DRAFT_681509 [Kockovaella imperatae]ORX36743.1 hypothetical protein BD324DRAFT_681509 [Kockovaella imperatae]
MLPEVAVAILGLGASVLTISSPDELFQCEPATFSWTPNLGPYILSVTLSDLAPTFNLSMEDQEAWVDGAEMVISIPEASTATWIVDLPEGLNVTTHIKDAEGHIASGYPRVIGPGHGACLMAAEWSEYEDWARTV